MRNMDGETREAAVRMLMSMHRLDASEAEIRIFEGMFQPVVDGVGRLYAMEGIRYAEPAPTFRAWPDPPPADRGSK
jgi:hypothetical protein